MVKTKSNEQKCPLIYLCMVENNAPNDTHRVQWRTCLHTCMLWAESVARTFSEFCSVSKYSSHPWPTGFNIVSCSSAVTSIWPWTSEMLLAEWGTISYCLYAVANQFQDWHLFSYLAILSWVNVPVIEVDMAPAQTRTEYLFANSPSCSEKVSVSLMFVRHCTGPHAIAWGPPYSCSRLQLIYVLWSMSWPVGYRVRNHLLQWKHAPLSTSTALLPHFSQPKSLRYVV